MPVPGIRCFVVSDPATSAGGSWRMGMGSSWGNIQPFFSTGLLGGLSHLTSLHLPFPAYHTIGQSLLLCACTGVLLEFPATAWLHCKLRCSSSGFQYIKYVAAETCEALLMHVVSVEVSLSSTCQAWPVPLWPYLFSFSSKSTFTSEALKVLYQRQHKAKTPHKWRFISLWITSPVQFLLVEGDEPGLGLQASTLGFFWIGRGQGVSAASSLWTRGTFCALCAGGRFGLVLFSMSRADASKLQNFLWCNVIFIFIAFWGFLIC